MAEQMAVVNKLFAALGQLRHGPSLLDNILRLERTNAAWLELSYCVNTPYTYPCSRHAPVFMGGCFMVVLQLRLMKCRCKVPRADSSRTDWYCPQP